MNIDSHVQNYDWGKRGLESYVAKLVHGKSNFQQIESNLPYAELWMGTHPNGPSIISNTNQKLSEYIKENPKCLGEKVATKFGIQLPYLFKVLSVAKALSIQAHPNKELAMKLYESRPDLYKDSNHKPELAIALTPFEALCGFRPVQEIKFFLQTIPELITVVGAKNVSMFLTSDEEGFPMALQKCFQSLMNQDTELISTQLQLLLNRFGSLDEERQTALLAPLVIRLNGQFPNDVGCFVVYFLNFLKLSPGEAIYLGPNEPHAYLSGDCVECMACSDNVVRAGLTPKFKDVDTLCNMLSYRMEPSSSKIFKSVKENDYTELYAPGIEDFAVAKIQAVHNMKAIELHPRASASIILVLIGSANYNDLFLCKGSIAFIHANNIPKITNVSSDFLAFQAFANV